MRGEGRRAPVLAGAAALALLAGCAFSTAPGTSPVAPEPAVELASHDLTVALAPAAHRLVARDRLTLVGTGGPVSEITLSLNPRLTVGRVSLGDRPEEEPLAVRRAPGRPETGTADSLHVTLPAPLAAGDRLVLDVAYEGVIDEPPGASRHLRFVAPSETRGHIGPEGVYLSGETAWYPDLPGSLATFTVRATVPEGWEVVTQGREVSRESASGRRITTWLVSTPSQALSLVANRFVTTQRVWRDITVAAYLFPEHAGLAETYLEAAQRFLGTYIEILGPYPFSKFAVVENFFPSGLGMPSFTLLGSGTIARRYVQPYALGHEIVHSWLGNAVFNDPEGGNWVEGLTTYLANYYYEELHGPEGKAVAERRRMVVGYAVYARPDEDYALSSFRQKTEPKDNAIGYQKAAMVVHMLRREIGEDAFWGGLRTFVATHLGKTASWRDLEAAFAAAAGRDLRWFFAQWVERPGAPEPVIRDVTAGAAPAAPGRYQLTVQLEQRQERPYRFRLPLAIHLAGTGVLTTDVLVEERMHVVRLPLDAAPGRLRVDPAYETFRRIPREAVPPMLNLFVTDRRRAVVVPTGGDAGARDPYEAVATHLAQREEGAAIRQVSGLDDAARRGSVLVLGGPEINEAFAWGAGGCPRDVDLRADRFTVGGATYEGPEMALLISCRRPETPEHVVTMFYGLSPGAAARVARLLFFYGWDSYLVFERGRPVARGDLPPATEPLTAVVTMD